MKYKIDQGYKANANASTFGLITLLMFGFAAVAQSQELGTVKSKAFSESHLCVKFVPRLCQQFSENQLHTSNPKILIQ
jgi:hypothetical protein